MGLFLVSWGDTLLGGDVCDGLEGRSRPAVAETEVIGNAESHELTEWQGVGWIY